MLILSVGFLIKFSSLPVSEHNLYQVPLELFLLCAPPLLAFSQADIKMTAAVPRHYIGHGNM